MPYYDPYSGQEVETEEERLKREQELANTAVHTQEVKTYGDGTQEVVTKREIPPEAQPQQPAQPRVAAPVAPQAINQAAYTAQQESGGKTNIGYHFPADEQGRRRSSAYGMYGITAPAYQDIQKANPAFAGRDITTLTPEEQTQAYQTFTDLNAQRLQKLGVEPTEANQRLAHLLGAGGAAKFLQTGEVSPQAAAANGGIENLKRIAGQRLQGAQAPASAAAEPTAPTAPVSPEEVARQQQYSLATGAGQPGLRVPGMAQPAVQPAVSQTQSAINTYQQNQDNPLELIKMHQDESQPEWMRRRAGERVADLMTQQRNAKAAEEMLPTLSQNDLAKIATKKSEGNSVGDWLQYLLFKHVGLNDLANQKGEQLGIGHKWESALDAEGNTGLIKYSASGKPLEGTKSNGQAMSAEELAAFTTGGGIKGVHQSADVYKDPTGKVKGSFVLETRPGSRPIYKEVGTGRPATAAESAVLNKTGVTGTLEQQAAAQQQKLNIRLQYEPAIAAASKGAATLAEFNAMNGTNYAIAGRDAQGLPLVVDQTSGQLLTKPQAAPSAAATAPAMAAPATTAPVTAPAPVSPAELQRQGKAQEEQSKAFVKFENDELLPMAQAGQTISRVRKEQIKGPDGILNNPEIASLLQGSSGGEVGNILRDLITGQFKDQADLSSRVASLNLNDRQKAVLYRQIGLNNQIAPLTLRANAGPGAVSDAEQKANRDANVDITRQPLYSGLSLLTKDQFLKDQQQARADFRAQNPQFKTTSEFNTAWNAEKSRLDKQYDNIYAARAAYIAKHNPMDKNGKATNPGAVVEAYKYYPVPEWNSETRSWDFGTDYSKRAARQKLSEFIR